VPATTQAQRATGGKAYGYISKDGTRRIDEAQAKIVRLIFCQRRL
jgi:hypothetical protein